MLVKCSCLTLAFSVNTSGDGISWKAIIIRAGGPEKTDVFPSSLSKGLTGAGLIVDRDRIDGRPSVVPRIAIVSERGGETLRMADHVDGPFKPGIKIHDLEERVATRRFADFETTILCSGGRRYAALIENISENGCRAQMLVCEPPDTGCVVIFPLPSFGYATGKVAWSRDNAIGIVFLVELASSSVNELVKLSLLDRLQAFSPQARPLKNLPAPARWMK